MTANLWDYDEAITHYLPDFDIPKWIEQDLSPADVAAIQQGGCASGAYMPAVTYHQALSTMADYGDEVLDYIEDALGELPDPRTADNTSWSGMASFFLSTAVELWAASAGDQLGEELEDA